MQKRKKIVVVGGGTAGWLAALYLNKFFHQFDVTVIESSSIGILGAGEGSTPHIIPFLDSLGITLTDVVKHAGATMKNGIKFTNWNNDGSYFFHSFQDLSEVSLFTHCKWNGYPAIAIDAVSNNNSLDSVNFSSLLSASNKVKYIKLNDSDLKHNGINHYQKHGPSSIHFNARKMASFLKQIGVSRGIEVLDCVVTDINLDENGFVNNLNLTSQETSEQFKEDCDFVIDCSGFHRLVIDKVYNSPWKSYSELLPVNRAIPFFIDRSIGEDTPPYTESIAMKYGWAWKIPVEGRYGCGYVFDSSLISDQQAKDEIKELVGVDVDFPTVFNFSAGYFEKPWIKNCLALGLASGFIEPLEATSIWTTMVSIKWFGDHIDGLTNKSQFSIDSFNKKFCLMNDDVFNFVYFHYLTKRNDTEFWNKFKNSDKHPEPVKRYLNYSCEWIPWLDNFKFEDFFGAESYLQVAYGIGHISPQVCSNVINQINVDYNLLKVRKESLNQNLNIDPFESHDSFLNNLRSYQ